ncbi:hypothetical protein RGRSB_0085 [cyanobacterium endosymbiont of Rhopalodia gibberula]|uniref:hypothetical protein n=1 Tax=cyanobacterium endosymbiont of Rhopalodia gibberula TaxID=1763363 RepID=UPI000DC6E8CC|nr:hypothetical protein [cyanobacterium endosymbiont of Rhopalodia gibberula]BBA78717.1 hypothetical protein RGRSB_0085 [cyanobacterium endosymbiont of Rhopalodia gibberula]
MSSLTLLKGEEREVKTSGGSSVDGTPLDYIVVLSTVVTVLALIPFSITIGSGGLFPMSQGIFPLVGWLLGPLAGAITSGMGTLIGVFLAPHTAGIPLISIWGAVIASFTAGVMSSRKGNIYWRFGLTFVFIIELILYTRHALSNGVSFSTIIAGSLIDWSGILLFTLPTCSLIAQCISSKKPFFVTVGVFFGTWMIMGLSHLNQVFITYYIFNWPEETWLFLIPIIPLENLVRSLIGTFIGIRVIYGLRAIGLMKPKQAIY